MTTTSTIPSSRVDLNEAAPRPMAAMSRLEAAIELEPRLRHLVVLRASQVNGCAFCIDMHWKDAVAAGESVERLYMLDAWPESTLYDDRERAALALCEAVTLLAEGHVPDEVWERAEAALGAELAQVLFAVTAINAWNRLMIASRAEAGHYEPGMFAG
jgi:AhpD family alkylhydroperoxidase